MFFGPKFFRGDSFLLRAYYISIMYVVLKYEGPTQNSNQYYVHIAYSTLHCVKISSSNSKRQARYSYMNIWGKKTVFFAPTFFQGDSFLLRAHYIFIMYIVLKYESPTPESNLDMIV